MLGEKYTPKVFSALKTQVPQQAKKRFGVYQKACFQGKKKENTYTPKSLQGGCGGPLRAALVYRLFFGLLNEVRQQMMWPVFLQIGLTPKGSCSPGGRSRHLLDSPPLLRTPSENPSQNPFRCCKTIEKGPLLRTLLRTLPQL